MDEIRVSYEATSASRSHVDTSDVDSIGTNFSSNQADGLINEVNSKFTII